MGISTATNKAVGQELAAVLPQDNKAWYQRSHLLKLNLLILSLCQLSSCNGYDGSIMVRNPLLLTARGLTKTL